MKEGDEVEREQWAAETKATHPFLGYLYHWSTVPDWRPLLAHANSPLSLREKRFDIPNST